MTINMNTCHSNKHIAPGNQARIEIDAFDAKFQASGNFENLYICQYVV
jgi:hypothetical protein